MRPVLTLLAARPRIGRFLATIGLWLTMCTGSFALIPPMGKYSENTETVPVEETITDGGIRMNIEHTIRLRAATGGLLVFVRTVKFLRTGETVHRPKYPPVKVSRSKDEGKTWSEPIEVHPTGVMPVATLLDNGIIVAFTGRGGNRVAASRDNGLTWHGQHNVMFTVQSPNFSDHNAIVPVGGGRALLIYSHHHGHPDNETGFADGNRYGAELIGTFVSFTEEVR